MRKTGPSLQNLPIRLDPETEALISRLKWLPVAPEPRTIDPNVALDPMSLLAAVLGLEPLISGKSANGE
jgi:hypothetical protein